MGGSSTLPGISPRSLGGRCMALADLSYGRGDNVVTTVPGLRFTFAGGIVTPIGGVSVPFVGVVSFSLGTRIR
jgi:hypothetical protein